VGFERHPPASKTWEPKHRVGGGGKPRSREAVRLFPQGFTRDDRPGEVECGGDGRKHSGRFVILGQAVQDASYHPCAVTTRQFLTARRFAVREAG